MGVQLRFLAVGFVVFAASAWPCRGLAQNEADVIESFAIDGNGGLLIVPVTVDGTEYPFAVDTGSTVAAFDTKLKGALKPTGEKVPFNGGELVELCECPTVTVGCSKLGVGSRAFCTDFAELRRETGYKVYGFLGMGLLEGKLVQIDFDAGKLSILKRGTPVAGKRIRITLDPQNLPFIDVCLPAGGETPFLIDTGCCGFRSGFLSKRTFGDLCRAKELTAFVGLKSDIGILSGTSAAAGLLAWQSVSGSRHENLVYTVDDSNVSSNALGLGYLCRYKVTLDFHNLELILEKGKWFDRACPANQAGIEIVTAEGNPIVKWVDTEGPAWKAGVRTGDRIVSIDGRIAQKLRLDQIGDELYSVRGGFTMKLVRATESYAYEIRLLQDPGPKPRGTAPRPVGH